MGEGRLTLAEFSERVGQALAARTRGELEPLTADLPAPSSAVVPAGRARTSWSVSPIGGTVRRGRWRVPARSVGVSIVGGASLDLAETEFAAPEVEVVRWSVIGGVSVTVPPGVRVEVSGLSLIGGHSVSLPEPAAGAPTLSITLYSLIGGVSVTSA